MNYNKAVAYVRVSSDIQDNERQISDISKYAKEHSIEIEQIFSDSISGTTNENEREGFQQLEKYLESHSIKHIIVWELSRLARKNSILFRIQEGLIERKIQLTCLNNPYFTLLDDKGRLKPDTSLVFSLMGTIANNELSQMKERFRSGKINKVKEGFFVGGARPPIGYIVNSDKRIIVDTKIIPELGVSKSEIVKEIFELYKDGASTKFIFRLLKGKYYPIKDAAYISKVLRYEVYYTGEFISSYGVNKVTPLIPQSLWEICREKRESNNSHLSKECSRVNVLKNILYCPYCGSKTTISKMTGYRCCNSQKNSVQACFSNTISFRILNSIVWGYCRGIIDKLKYNGFLESQIENIDAQIESNNEKLFHLGKLKDDITKKRQRLKKLYMSDMISDLELDQDSIEIKKEEVLLSRDISQLELENTQLQKSKDSIAPTLEDLFNGYTHGISDAKEIKSLLNIVLNRVELYRVSKSEKVAKIKFKDNSEIDIYIDTARRSDQSGCVLDSHSDMYFDGKVIRRQASHEILSSKEIYYECTTVINCLRNSFDIEI